MKMWLATIEAWNQNKYELRKVHVCNHHLEIEMVTHHFGLSKLALKAIPTIQYPENQLL